MNCQEMIEAMAAKGYWKSPGGKTPAATLYSAISVATDRLLCAGMHMHFPGFLNLNRRPGGGYELVPEI